MAKTRDTFEKSVPNINDKKDEFTIKDFEAQAQRCAQIFKK
jgi:hypothetical protein